MRRAIVPLALLLALATGAVAAEATAATPAEHPRSQVVRVDPTLEDRIEGEAQSFCELLNLRHPTETDFARVLDPAFVDRTTGLLWGDPTGPPLSGAPGLAADLAAIAATFPDYSFALKQVTIASDEVFLLVVFRGTQSGPLADFPPTGKRVAIVEIDRLRLRDGRIVERRSLVDERGLLWQIGVVTRL